MRDKSKQLLVINTGKKKSEQTGMPSQSGTTHIIGGGGLSVNMSDYLLKSIWDKVFEIRTDSQGTEYIFGKLPMVTQYGITMYSGDGVDIPSLASGLPFDGRTIWYNPNTQQIEVIGGTGGGSGEGVSNFWDLSGIPSWITISKPKYTYSEIEGTPDLSGYATESWVLGKSYITSATLGTELGKYVTLDTDQSLKGKKDFKNGLSIDGLEIRKSQDDVVYIDANLVVRGGVTMYAQNEVDIPSIIDSIPTASTTVKGIASFDGAYFSVVNGKVSLIASNVGLNEEELYNYLTSNNYAKKTDIPSLVGYATQSWVNTRIDSLINGAPAAYDTLKEIADVLQGNVNSIGDIITALGTKWTQDNTKIANWDTAYSWGNHANVGYALKSYVDSTFVTLGSTQTITGEKNFTTGGLFVNGSQIKYDATKKYWKLEGDLLVTGGVTMYGNDSSFNPSTIMDAIAVDGTTISKDGGVLKVIGGTGGGGADSVAWANITGKPTFATVATSGKYSDLSGTPSSLPASDVYSWAKSATKPTYKWSEITSKPTWIGSSKPSYSYSEITGAISTTELQNYLTQNSYLNVTSGDNRYLKLSGGTLTDLLTLQYSNPRVVFKTSSNEVFGSLGVFNGKFALYTNSDNKYNNIIHSGNYQNYALPLTGGKIKGVLKINGNDEYNTPLVIETPSMGDWGFIQFHTGTKVLGHIGMVGVDMPVFRSASGTNNTLIHSGNYSSYALPLSGGTITGPIQVGHYTSFGVAGENFYLGSPLYPLLIRSNGDAKLNGNTIWHSGNDGSYSGLDADLLDGNEGSWYIRNVLNFQEVKGSNNAGGCDLNALNYGLVKNYSSASYWANAPSNFSYGMVLNLKVSSTNDLMGQLAWDVNHHGKDSTKGLYWRAKDDTELANAKWHQIAFTDSNVASASQVMINYSYNQDVNFPLVFTSRDNIGAAKNGAMYIDYYGRPTYNTKTDTLTVGNLSGNASSATKLQTSRTIWGQSFNGTGNVDGNVTVNTNSNCIFYAETTSTSSSNAVIRAFAPNLSASQNLLYLFGKTTSTYNSANIAYRHIGDASNKNYLGFGLYGVDNILNVVASGNVGIGTTSPSSKLHLCSTENTTLRIQSDGSGGDQGAICMKKASGNGLVFAVENRDFIWQTGSVSFTGGGTERMRLTSGGNVGIGTGSPTRKLDIVGSMSLTGEYKIGGYDVLRCYNSALEVGREISFYQSYSTNIWGYGINFYNSGGTRLLAVTNAGNFGFGVANPSAKLHVSGDILATGGITMYSMRALKNVVDERGLSLNELSTIKPTRYTWKDGRDNRLHFGGIADDIQQVLPEVVYSTSEGILTMDYGNAAFAVASSLIQPVVDHEKRIAMLEEENKQLRQEVELLKAS